jgi:recombination protein RecA
LFRSTEFDIEYGKGLSKSGEILDMGLREGILEKSGAWYSIAADGRQLGQGREKAKAYLEENPEIAQELDKLIREKVLTSGSDRSSFVANAGGSSSLPRAAVIPPVVIIN